MSIPPTPATPFPRWEQVASPRLARCGADRVPARCPLHRHLYRYPASRRRGFSGRAAFANGDRHQDTGSASEARHDRPVLGHGDLYSRSPNYSWTADDCRLAAGCSWIVCALRIGSRPGPRPSGLRHAPLELSRPEGRLVRRARRREQRHTAGHLRTQQLSQSPPAPFELGHLGRPGSTTVACSAPSRDRF